MGVCDVERLMNLSSELRIGRLGRFFERVAENCGEDAGDVFVLLDLEERLSDGCDRNVSCAVCSKSSRRHC